MWKQTLLLIGFHGLLQSQFIIEALLLLCLLCNKDASAAVAAPVSGVAALMAMKGRIGDSWGNLANWQGHAASPCSWTGVVCNAGGMVVGLELHSLNLTGTLSEDIGYLTQLSSLNVSNNGFSGKLPLSIAQLTQLERVDVGTNMFSGVFPSNFSLLQALQVFSASNNNFTGPLPLDFAQLPALQYLDLSGSYFEGSILVEYSNISTLKVLRLSSNLLTGSLPKELGSLSDLRLLEIGYNTYSGTIPRELGNLSKLEYLDMAASNLWGSIPEELGQLSFCNTTFLFKNRLTGVLPPELGSMTNLMSLDVSENNLTGSIPQEFSKLQNLTLLSLMFNNFSGILPAFVGDLPYLETLKIFNNLFSGPLPPHLGRASSLRWLDASNNFFNGSIPESICSGGGLVKLELFLNELTGPIPDLRSCLSVVRVRLQDNQLTGSITGGLGVLQNLTRLELAKNRIGGTIPEDLGMAPSLAFVDLSNNVLEGALPGELWRLPHLQVLHASDNNLSGIIPEEIGSATTLLDLDLSSNVLTGPIPETIKECKKLVTLDLRFNKLTGAIPAVLGDLPSLATLDISHNAFTGSIPGAFEKLTNLELLNVSYNNLSGSLPSLGIFKTASPSWFDGNSNLCGAPLPECSNAVSANDGGSLQERKVSSRCLAWLVGGIFTITLVILIVGTRCFYAKYGHFIRSSLTKEYPECPWKLTAFQKLGFTAYDILECLKESNIIGKGAAGTVYKAEVSSGEVVAVKKLRRSLKDRSKDRGFHAEVQVLGGIRHRNIVRLLGYCSNGENNLLIYEYMTNGSLGQLLHGKESAVLADWLTRYHIAIGVAQGLCYLHHDCFPHIVHRDVKSNNILLDCKMEARVADFGVAKLVDSNESMSMVAGSYGYIAPEYAYTMKVDEKSDIYSYGVVLLELLTGKRPSEPEFGEAVNIVEWVREKAKTKQGVMEVLDSNIGALCSSVQEELMLVLRVALLCTSKNPRDRPSMRDVVTMLSEAKPRRKSIMEKLSPSSKFVK